MAAKKFPAMAEVGMHGRLAGPARDEIFQFRSQLRFQLGFVLGTRFSEPLNSMLERVKEAKRCRDEEYAISNL